MTGLLIKAALKAASLFILGISRIRCLFSGDKTKILLDTRTPAQRAAEEARSRAPLGAPSAASVSLSSAGLSHSSPPGNVSPTPAGSVRLLVVIPFRDNWPLTHACLDALSAQRFDSQQLHILLVDNGSREESTLAGVQHWLARSRFQTSCIRDDRPFNFSALNNQALPIAKTLGVESLLFLNNDVVLEQPDSLLRLLAFAENTPQQGALGSTLVYPNRRVQHLFLAPGIKICGAHPGQGFKLDLSQAWYAAPRCVPAVTGALLWVRTEAFAAVGGFEEELATSAQDLDLCLKLQRHGLTNWVLPEVIAVHHENATRSRALNRREIEWMYAKWGNFLVQNPFCSEKLSRWSQSPALSLGEGPYPWRLALRSSASRR